MRRTLTLAALATAGLLRLDAATAFQVPLGARSAGGGAVSGLRPGSISASLVSGPRPKVSSLCMDAGSPGGGGGAPTQAPEVTAVDGAKAAPAAEAVAAPATEGAPAAGAAEAAAKVEGGEGEKVDVAKGEGSSSTVEASAAVKKPEVPAEAVKKPEVPAEAVKKPEVPAEAAKSVAKKVGAVPAPAPKEEPLTDLEKAFAEAKKRSQAQDGPAKIAAAAAKAAPKPKVEKKPEAAATESKASPTAAKPAAAKPAPTAAKPAAAKPAPTAAKPVAAKPAPTAAAPKSEGLKARTTAGQVKKPAPVKGSPPREAEVMKIKGKPKAEISEAAAPEAEKEEPKAKAAPAKAKAAKAPPAEKTGAFSLGAESLEEFFGLTKKPRLVSTTTPPSDDPEPSPMAELDPAAVKSMIEENGLNEVTLKENFRQMEAEAKAAQEGGETPMSPEAIKVAAAAAKRATSLTPNPVVGVLSSMFSLGSATDPRTGDPDIAPPVPSSKNAAPATREAKAVDSRPKSPAAKPKAVAAAPKVAAAKPKPKPKPVAPQVVAKEVEVEEGEKAEGGLSGLLSGMFGTPVYDDEVDTIPKMEPSAARALPVFAPPPAPAKAPPARTPPPTPKAAAPSQKKSDAPAAPSFMDGLFGGSKKAAEPKEVTAPPAPTPAAVVKEKKPPAPSMFDGLFGGGGAKTPEATETPKRPSVSTPAAAAKAASPAKAKAPVKTPTKAPTKAKAPSGGSESLFAGLFGGGAKEDKAAAATAPAPVPVPASAPKAPAFSMFGMKGGKDEKEEKKPSRPSSTAVSKANKKKAPPPAVPEKKSPSGGMFDFLGGGATKSAPPVPEPEPEPERAKPASSNPFSSLFGGGSEKAEPSSKPKASAAAQQKPKPKPKRAPPPPPARPAPTPAVSRVKTMDDSFLRKVSVMLKRNQAKIKKFQQLTDRFRGGLIKAPVYYAGVEELFGEDNVEEIIGPLLAALPENDKRKTLQDVYNKAQKAKNGSSGEPKGGGFGGLLGGWGAKSDSKKGAAAKPAAPADPYAFAAAKLSEADYKVFQSRTVLFSRGGINARNYYDTLAKVFGAKGVSQQMPALMKALPQNKRKLLQDVVDGLSK